MFYLTILICFDSVSVFFFFITASFFLFLMFCLIVCGGVTLQNLQVQRTNIWFHF